MRSKKTRSILTTEGLRQADVLVESMRTLASKMHNLESRVESLETEITGLLFGFTRWADENTEFMRNKERPFDVAGFEMATVQLDDLRERLALYSAFLEGKKYEWAVQCKTLHLQSCGFKIGDLEDLEQA